MTFTLTCRKCATEIVAPTEDELVQRVQEHVTVVHAEPGGHGHTPTRQHVLYRLRRGEQGGSQRRAGTDGHGHDAP